MNPEVRLGYHFTEQFEASLGFQAFVLIATKQPTWDAKIERDGLKTDGTSTGIYTYPEDTLTGPFVLFLVPTIAARYNF